MATRFSWLAFLVTKVEPLESFSKTLEKPNWKEFHDIRKRSNHHGWIWIWLWKFFVMKMVLYMNYRLRELHKKWSCIKENYSLHEMARTMLNPHSLPTYFWTKAVNMTWFIAKHVLLDHNKEAQLWALAWKKTKYKLL